MKDKFFVKNLSNKNPTKDITADDLKYKIPRMTSKKNVAVKINKKITFSEKNIPIIAGPNGVESRELIFKIAKSLKKKGIKLLRGHAYKPLTFPYRSKKYSETKSEGMDWLDEVKKFLGLNIVTEVTEIQFLDSNGVQFFNLGKRKLRSETAIQACLGIFNELLG